MNIKEIYDTIEKHLLTQKAKSMVEDDTGYRTCFYRHQNGMSCAIGCLFPKDYDVSKLEGNSVTSDIVMNSLREINVVSDYEIFAFSTLQISSDKISMLKQLQLIHDTLDIGRWLNELEILKNIFIKDNL